MLDYLDDLASDFAVFYRIDDIRAMPGPLFCKYAWRVSAYQGVMRVRIEAIQAKEAKTHDGRPREFVSNEQADSIAGGGYFEKVSG